MNIYNILKLEKYFTNLSIQNSCDEKEREKMIKQNELRI